MFPPAQLRLGWLDLSKRKSLSHLFLFLEPKNAAFLCCIHSDIWLNWKAQRENSTERLILSTQPLSKNIIGFFSAWLQKLLWISTRWFPNTIEWREMHASNMSKAGLQQENDDFCYINSRWKGGGWRWKKKLHNKIFPVFKLTTLIICPVSRFYLLQSLLDIQSNCIWIFVCMFHFTSPSHR